MYANTYMWIYTYMPEYMREGTDQMDSMWQWKCKMTTEMLQYRSSLLMVINVKQ